ncbi:EamA family transporter [Georgenia deserti]|uniref:EamA family transporter n=1 Tax=Georgenia deserti TaxID=2093781 RepID=A0ABW4L6B8_9MICO
MARTAESERVTPPPAPPATAARGRLDGRVAVLAATALAPASWGTTYAVTTEFLPPDHPMFAGLMRSLPVGLLALALTRCLPSGSWWWKAAVLGVLNIGAFFPLLFLAAERLPGGVAATLGAVQPLAVGVLAIAVLRESPSWWRLGWGAAGLLGVGLVVLTPAAALDAAGVVAGLAATASMGLGLVLIKRWGRPPGVSSMTFTGWLLTFGGLALAPLALVVEGAPATVDAGAVGGYLWLGLIGGLLAYTLWYRGLSRLPVTATALLVLLSPLVAAAVGVLAVGERFSPAQAAGFALALLALLAGQFTGRQLRTPPRTESGNPSQQRMLKHPLEAQVSALGGAGPAATDADHVTGRPTDRARGGDS